MPQTCMFLPPQTFLLSSQAQPAVCLDFIGACSDTHQCEHAAIVAWSAVAACLVIHSDHSTLDMLQEPTSDTCHCTHAKPLITNRMTLIYLLSVLNIRGMQSNTNHNQQFQQGMHMQHHAHESFRAQHVALARVQPVISSPKCHHPLWLEVMC